MNHKDSELFNNVYRYVREILEDSPGCHDFLHTQRVLHHADLLLQTEKVQNPFAVRLAALLHDCARPEELASSGKICHAELGAEKAVDILRKCGCTDSTFIQLISDCIRTHRYRNQIRPATWEAKVVYDADKLDSIGAFGIARAFYFAGRIGAVIHNTDQEALSGKEYSRQDSAYREYLVKLKDLPAQLQTESAKKIAGERCIFMQHFFEQMNREAGYLPLSSEESL